MPVPPIYSAAVAILTTLPAIGKMFAAHRLVIMRYTFKCSDTSCGHIATLNLSPKGDVSGTRFCPLCQKHTLDRNLLADVKTVLFNTEGSDYNFRFPYVSSTFPFGGDGADHFGPLKKCVIRDANHEAQMRAIHGFAGEDKVIGEDPDAGTVFSRPQAPEFEPTEQERAIATEHLKPEVMEALGV